MIGWVLVFGLDFVKLPTTNSADGRILLVYVRVHLPHGSPFAKIWATPDRHWVGIPRNM